MRRSCKKGAGNLGISTFEEMQTRRPRRPHNLLVVSYCKLGLSLSHLFITACFFVFPYILKNCEKNKWTHCSSYNGAKEFCTIFRIITSYNTAQIVTLTIIPMTERSQGFCGGKDDQPDSTTALFLNR